MGGNHQIPWQVFLLWLVEFHWVWIILQEMEHYCTRLALLFHIRGYLPILEVWSQKDIHPKVLNLHNFRCHSLSDHHLCFRIFLSDPVHPFHRSRYFIHNSGIILIQNAKNLKGISVNLAFWLEMYIGGSLLFTFYLVESFARKRISDEFIMG